MRKVFWHLEAYGLEKNRPWSPILELDLEIHLVHKRGEYHQARFDAFQWCWTQEFQDGRADARMDKPKP